MMVWDLVIFTTLRPFLSLLPKVMECIHCACSLCVFGLMVVFNIGCICCGASLGGIIRWINSAICLKSSYSLGGFILWVSLGGFNRGL